jgi:hypothetical protein
VFLFVFVLVWVWVCVCVRVRVCVFLSSEILGCPLGVLRDALAPTLLRFPRQAKIAGKMVLV